MPIADVRRALSGSTPAERQELFITHRARLEKRLHEVLGLLAAVDALALEENPIAESTGMSSWQHVMPRFPVIDMDRSIVYYEEVLGLRLAWRTTDGRSPLETIVDRILAA